MNSSQLFWYFVYISQLCNDVYINTMKNPYCSLKNRVVIKKDFEISRCVRASIIYIIGTIFQRKIADLSL